MLQPLNAEQCSLTLAARIRIVNESRFKDGLQLIIEIMMDDSVAERCREDFPLDRVVDDEADAAARGVCAATDIFIQRDDILRESALELHLGCRVAFVVACRVIGSEKIREQGVCRLRL
jgi:hypothetical protein